MTLVFNNNSYGNVRDQIERFDGRVVASELVNPDFVRSPNPSASVPRV